MNEFIIPIIPTELVFELRTRLQYRVCFISICCIRRTYIRYYPEVCRSQKTKAQRVFFDFLNRTYCTFQYSPSTMVMVMPSSKWGKAALSPLFPQGKKPRCSFVLAIAKSTMWSFVYLVRKQAFRVLSWTTHRVAIQRNDP